MRKLLLASAATVGMVGAAAAQTTVVQTQAPPAPIGVMGIPSQPSSYLGGNNSLNSDGSALPVSPNTPTPGTMTIHMNGRVWGYLGVQGGSSSSVGGNKVNPEQFIGYFRLYPGVDALATNGLRYGAIVEIRQNYTGPVLRPEHHRTLWTIQSGSWWRLLQQRIWLQLCQHAVCPARGGVYRLRPGGHRAPRPG